MEHHNTNIRAERFTPSQRRTRKRVLIGRLIFTAFLLAYIGTALYFGNYGYGLLMDWLVQLEASQPDIRSEEVFQELFAQPDWAALYEMAGEEDTLYEGVEAYERYMEALVGDTALSYVETSAGLSGDKKFIVKAEDIKVAEFTLENMAPEGEQIAQWELGQVSVFYTRQESLTVFTVPGHTVYINGVAIDTEAHKISTTSTIVEDYLEEGLHGYQDMTLLFDGLLIQPEVTILDENGQSMPVSYDPATKLYAEQLAAAAPMTEEQETAVIGAAQSFGRYMIRVRDHKLRDFYDKNGPAYQDILASVVDWIQDYKSYDFSDISITDFYQYSDTYFSAHVSMMMNVTRPDGSVKAFHLDTTYFVRQNSEGKWLVETMTNVNVQQQVRLVKLEFINGNTVVDTLWVEADARQITLPVPQASNGKEFAGWFTKTVSGTSTSYSLVFSPSEDGVINLPLDYVLEPMVLYAQFQ